jgi:hypothetical protein
MSGVLGKVREAVAKGDPDALERKAVDRFIEATPESNRSSPAFVVASYLAGRQRHEAAKPYWQLAARAGQLQPLWGIVAGPVLRERYAEPAKAGPRPKK